MCKTDSGGGFDGVLTVPFDSFTILRSGKHNVNQFRCLRDVDWMLYGVEKKEINFWLMAEANC